ncbi:MAG: zf-HC2 domain-containing protein [Acidobacteriaceae bacterium]|nr:zf-HC2 domain-containing protein [Acidobacteriaceae bacterium]
MNCTDFLAKLSDFFDGTIDPALLDEVKAHLCSCHHCEVVVDTTRHTIDFYRADQQFDLPEPVADKLRSAIMDRCRTLGKPEKQIRFNPGTAPRESLEKH